MNRILNDKINKLNELLKAIEDTHDYSSLRETVAEIYEEVLVLEFTEARKKEHNKILLQVEKRVSGSSPEVEVKVASNPPAEVFEEKSSSFMSDEIKVVPIPQGPPKPNQVKEVPPPAKAEEPVKVEEPRVEKKEPVEKPSSEKRLASVNDRANQGPLKLGLNDRIAFVKHLFNGSQEDLDRVLNQLNTMTSISEVEDFLQAVKADYNNWEGKEEYEERLVEMLTVRFMD